MSVLSNKFPNIWVNLLETITRTTNEEFLVRFVHLFPDVFFNFNEVVSVEGWPHGKESPALFPYVHKSTVLNHLHDFVARWSWHT